MQPKFMATFIPIIIGTALCFLQPLKAQDFFIKHYDSILQPIDKSPITSHILIDRVGPINQIVGYNNNTDTIAITNKPTKHNAHISITNAQFSVVQKQHQGTSPNRAEIDLAWLFCDTFFPQKKYQNKFINDG